MALETREPGTRRQYRYRHNEKKWSPLVILIIIHSQDGEGEGQEALNEKEGAPLWRRKTCGLGFDLHQMLMQFPFLHGKTCALGFI